MESHQLCELTLMLKSHGERPTKGVGGKRKGVDEYAAEHEHDLTVGTLDKDGHLVRLLMCRHCNLPIGARSDRIKEHFISKRHLKNKMNKPSNGNVSLEGIILRGPMKIPGRANKSQMAKVQKLAAKVKPIPPATPALNGETSSTSSLSPKTPSRSEVENAKRIPVVKLIDISKSIQECNLCGRVDLMYNIRKHEKMFHNIYKCTKCTYEGDSGLEYRVHLSLHDFVDPCSCKYVGCGKSFVNRTTLRFHVWRNHWVPKTPTNSSIKSESPESEPPQEQLEQELDMDMIFKTDQSSEESEGMELDALEEDDNSPIQHMEFINFDLL